MSQTTNSLTPIGMAVAIAGQYMRSGDLVQSDSLAQLRSWARPPAPTHAPPLPTAAETQSPTALCCFYLCVSVPVSL